MERKAVARKKKEVENLTEKLEKAKSFYIVDYTGLDANAMNILRGKFRSGDYEYIVIKNSILQRASDKLGFKEIEEILAGPNSISISYDDPIGPARIINEYYKEANLPTVKLCYIEGKWFSAQEVKRLADLPSREVLVGQVLNVMISPLSGFINLLQNHLSGLLRVVDGIREQKEKEEAPAAEETADAPTEEAVEQKAEAPGEEQGKPEDEEAGGGEKAEEKPERAPADADGSEEGAAGETKQENKEEK